MCFEFEALYWAKLAEEEQQRKEAEQRARQAESLEPESRKPGRPVYDDDAVTA